MSYYVLSKNSDSHPASATPFGDTSRAIPVCLRLTNHGKFVHEAMNENGLRKCSPLWVNSSFTQAWLGIPNISMFSERFEDFKISSQIIFQPAPFPSRPFQALHVQVPTENPILMRLRGLLTSIISIWSICWVQCPKPNSWGGILGVLSGSSGAVAAQWVT